jgi:hypothetical protein
MTVEQTNAPNIEQVSEFRRTMNRGSEPAPPRAAEFGKGATSIEQIREATEARRQQSALWTNRDKGPVTPGHSDHK